MTNSNYDKLQNKDFGKSPPRNRGDNQEFSPNVIDNRWSEYRHEPDSKQIEAWIAWEVKPE